MLDPGFRYSLKEAQSRPQSCEQKIRDAEALLHRFPSLHMETGSRLTIGYGLFVISIKSMISFFALSFSMWNYA